ncbi:sperm acrosome membrane-associated protein 6 isoform X2 [Mastomys coucha]|nr:sperm acrosome membrane-associated protein 6 isoform X2 [Mastomys coucha]
MEFFPLDPGQLRGRGVGGSQAGQGWAVGRGRAGAPRGGGRSEATLPAGTREGEPGSSVPGGGTGRRQQATGGGGWRGWREEEERPRAAEEGEDGEAGAGAGGGQWVLATLELRSDYDERSHLHDEFTQMTISLHEMADLRVPFWIAFSKSATTMKKIIEGLPKAQVCIPPCGVQEATRQFHCQGCYSAICDLPLDCPVQDMLVNRGDQALFSCIVAFQLPESEVSYSWKFAGGGIRTRDISYFRDLPGAHGYLARIRPVKPSHSGTFTCAIVHDQRPLARLYFYLNVTGPPPPEETKLQVTFREVLLWTPPKAEKIQPWEPSLGELLTSPRALTFGNLFLLVATAALGSASVIVLV